MNSTTTWSTSEQTREALAANSLFTLLSRRIENKTAKIGVVGMGQVGLPLALLFARKGFHTFGFDMDLEKIEMLWRGESYLQGIPAESIALQIGRKTFVPRTDFSTLAEMDAVLICGPTPVDPQGKAGFSFVKDAAFEISKHLRHGQLIVLECSTSPRTTDEILLSILEESGLHCPVASSPHEGENISPVEAEEPDFFLAYAPKRESAGSKAPLQNNMLKTIAGVNEPSALAAEALYQCAFERTVILGS